MDKPVISLERIIPDEMDMDDPFDRQSYDLHMERYRFAVHHLKGNKILDIACGTGYGTHTVATEIGLNDTDITAVDIDPAAIALAQQRYNHPAINYLVSDVFAFNTSKRFDSIISLETIEHLDDPVRFVTHLRNLLMPGGRLIISAPVTPSMDANPHHKQDFTPVSFRNLFDSDFGNEIGSLRQVQSFSLQQVLLPKKQGRAADIRHSMLRYYLQNPSAILKRARALLQHGFNNIYLTMVFEKK